MPVLWEPLVLRAPVQAPLALQLVASVLDQIRVVALPLSIVPEEALRLTPGLGTGCTTVMD
jgi:hypothetical protein